MRPASLPIAIGPVLVGAAMGFLHKGAISLPLAAMALAGALLMQLLTNLQNDVGFTARGSAKVGERVGLPPCHRQWLAQPRRGAHGHCVAQPGGHRPSARCVTLRGWPVAGHGRRLLGGSAGLYGRPQTDCLHALWRADGVCSFFGLVAVLGTDWLLTDQLSLVSALAAAAIGCLSAAALGVNNHRDMAHDKLVGRRTFAICFGAQASMAMMGTLLLAPFALCLGMVWAQSAPMSFATAVAVAHRLATAAGFPQLPGWAGL